MRGVWAGGEGETTTKLGGTEPTQSAHRSQQWRSQDFIKEGSEVHGAPRYSHQKQKTHRIWPTIFLEGAQFDELKKKTKEKRKCQAWGAIPGLRRPSLYLVPQTPMTAPSIGT